MKKICNKILTVVLLMVLICTNSVTQVKAASASINITSETCEKDGTVTVNIDVSSGEEIYQCDLWIQYDPNILEPVSGFDTVAVYEEKKIIKILSQERTSFSIVFRGKAVGISDISIDTNSYISSISEDRLALSISNGSVTVNAPVSYSSNNNLSSLQIAEGTLSPAFSPDVTTYTTAIGADVGSLTVSAVTQDSSARVSVTGTRMDPGKNTTNIIVTAENGAQKVYKIYTTKDTANSPQEENPQETAGNTSPESVVVRVGDKVYTVNSDFSKNPLPQGYTESDYTLEGQQIKVGIGNSNRLIIMYLESDTEIDGFYIYDTTGKTFSPLVTVSEPDLEFIILAINDNMEIPEGFTKTLRTINDKNVDILLPTGANPEYCLIYAIAEDGNAGWYTYDLNNGSIQKAYSLPAVSNTDDIQVSTEPTDSKTDTPFWEILAYVLIGVGLIQMIIVMVMVFKRRSKYFDLSDNNIDDESVDDELSDSTQESLQADEQFNEEIYNEIVNDVEDDAQYEDIEKEFNADEQSNMEMFDEAVNDINSDVQNGDIEPEKSDSDEEFAVDISDFIDDENDLIDILADVDDLLDDEDDFEYLDLQEIDEDK